MKKNRKNGNASKEASGESQRTLRLASVIRDNLYTFVIREGMKALDTMLEQDRERLCGPAHARGGRWKRCQDCQTMRRSLYFSAKQGEAGLAVTPGNLVISVGGQVLNPPGTCPGNTCPFTLLAATGGQYMAVVHVPLSLYPSAPGKLDLSISLDQSGTALSDTEPGALVVGSAPQIPATVLAVDTSGSMEDDGKLAAAKVAAKFVIDGMNDFDIAGLVDFSTQSLTVQDLGFVL